MVVEEDAEDLIARMEKEHQRQIDEELKRRPMAVQRDLPRPLVVNPLMAKAKSSSEAESLVAQEMVTMLKHDLVAYPIVQPKKSKKKQKKKQVSDGSYC